MRFGKPCWQKLIEGSYWHFHRFQPFILKYWQSRSRRNHKRRALWFSENSILIPLTILRQLDWQVPYKSWTTGVTKQSKKRFLKKRFDSWEFDSGELIEFAHNSALWFSLGHTKRSYDSSYDSYSVAGEERALSISGDTFSSQAFLCGVCMSEIKWWP